MVVVTLLTVVNAAADVDAVDVALVVLAAAPETLPGEAGSDIGDDGGDVLMSSSSGDLLVGFTFGAPFKAELLANCK